MFATVKTALLTGAAVLAAVPAFAEEVNVYSNRQPELLQPLLDAFTEETGIDVNMAYLSQGLVERLQAEGDRTPADLVFTVDISRLDAVVDAGLTQPLMSDYLKEHVPALYHDPEGQWWGLTTRARVVYASKDRVADSDITTYEDLADPKWKGRICTRSGTHEYMLALSAAMIAHHGEEYTKTWLQGLKDNLARKPEGNDRAQVKAIWAGQCDISLGNTYYMGQMLEDPEQIEWANSVRMLFPVFEGGGTHINISGVAMTKSAPNHDNAVKLIEFLASPKGQEIYAEANSEYPISPESKPSELVASWGTFTPDSLDLRELANLRDDALRITQEVDFDG
ncbi:Fe(3+) ABC transporter substrate-binding protein [Donghicola mangrovi]|uniref:Fe(3+) ABC transporter substrate-binding protein n=1 Tax=Donghicola mangrovi TaxID=2729614 RepID=A0A850QA16_9RHOB|nr:Fe(3+) ABC transporter substrate-binding protein [Donghicola mangrovi]NVO23650.1 Fe(3+) ABC transporter substrate-binding protein [Donghicola mangrovi]